MNPNVFPLADGFFKGFPSIRYKVPYRARNVLRDFLGGGRVGEDLVWSLFCSNLSEAAWQGF